MTSSFGLACRVIEALDMDVSKFYHGDYYLGEELKTIDGRLCYKRRDDLLMSTNEGVES